MGRSLIPPSTLLEVRSARSRAVRALVELEARAESDEAAEPFIMLARSIVETADRFERLVAASKTTKRRTRR